MKKQELWSDEEINFMQQLNLNGITKREIAESLTERFGRTFTYASVKSKLERVSNSVKKDSDDTPINAYKETTEILGDGSHRSDKLLKMSAEQKKDENYLLQAHGYNPSEWDLITSKSSIWNQHNKQDGTLTLYASKITVKPKNNGFDWDSLLKKIESIPSIIIKPKHRESEKYLNLPLFDMHFGVSNFEYYRETQQDILHLLEGGYKEVLFIIGQDLLHNDDFRGRTSSGREIEKVNMEKAWEEAMLFYVPLINKALEKCNKVTIVYSKGNHDESMSWAFVKTLEARFPQVNFDTRFKERKAYMLGLNFVGINHGDKKKLINLTENFSTEFPLLWSKATTREIFTGHEHHEKVIDKGGAVLRRMPTGNDIDDYHDDYGYTTAHKRFEVFEYNESKVLRIHYV